MAIAHNLGFPRIGAQREMKKAVEAYWRGDISQQELLTRGQDIQQENWKTQKAAGLDLIPVGDFSFYDHVLDLTAMLGIIPDRFGKCGTNVDLDTVFCMARGQAPNGSEAPAMEMTKWFDTNYHYIVPEFSADQEFRIARETLFESVEQAIALGHNAKPVILGPLSLLWLGKTRGDDFDKLALLDRLIPVYNEIFQRLRDLNVTWVQIDEPILVLDLPKEWQTAYSRAYQQCDFAGLKCLLATYFGGLQDNLQTACDLPVAGLHIDIVRSPEQLDTVINALPEDRVLSLGIVNGRNIWSTDLTKALEVLQTAHAKLGDRLWIAGSCSLLHVPVDLDQETELDAELKGWLAFAKQKSREIAVLAKGINEGVDAIAAELDVNKKAFASRQTSPRIHNQAVKQRCNDVTPSMLQRQNIFKERKLAQTKALNLPLLATTTVGSFPQTQEIRITRRDFKNGSIDEATYQARIREQMADVIARQEALGLDVLVHGEAERNDMVEYFGELLDGFAFTKFGWVQSYGSRCVKPPIIYGDVSRPAAMTVEWTSFAQSLTDKYMKGMLTGPVTILCWSFVRDDQPRSVTSDQIALALRDEVVDLERAGIKIIQIDEPAFREGLPLRRGDWAEYLEWAAASFRLSASGVEDSTQIHTHMCYSEFNDIIDSIAALDADVITLESSRSDMELLQSFETFDYPNEIGPGVYDIHSPRVPSVDEMTTLLNQALQYVPAERLWVNPDCGLKTRGWPEVEKALANMVATAKLVRERCTNDSLAEVE